MSAKKVGRVAASGRGTKNRQSKTRKKEIITLKEAISMFLEQYRESSALSYGSNLKVIAGLIGPERPIRSITSMHILEVQTYFNDPDRGYAPATRTKYVKVLRTFFNWLAKNKFIAESPASFLKAPRVNPYVDPQKAMTDEELAKLLDFTRWKPRDFALVLFLADTGARAGGAAGLRWRDIDFDELRALVTEKGDKTRPVAFGPLCAEALKKWYDRRPKSAGEYVFSPKKTPMKSACISQIITRACVAVGNRPLGSHSLRHRKGHQFAQRREAPTTAALAMGHSDVMVTMGAYYPQGWARTEEALRSLTVQSVSDLLVPDQPPPPLDPAKTEPKPRQPKLTVLKGKLSS